MRNIFFFYVCNAMWAFGFSFYLTGAGFVQATEYYVSVSGSDANSGSPAQPFRTIQKAQEVVRQQAKTQDIRVRVMPGRYELAETLSFGVEDGGANSCHVIYEAYNSDDPPIIDGGFFIGTNGWVNESGNLWYTDVLSGCNPRRLYANGRRQIRAREPDFDLDAGVEYGDSYVRLDPLYQYTVRQISAPLLPAVQSFQNSERTAINADVLFPSVQQSDYAEIVSFGHWNSTRALLSSVSGSSIQSYNRVGISGTAHLDLLVGEQFFLEHAKSFLDTAGEWWHDRANSRIYYHSSLDPGEYQFWVPKLDQLLAVTGSFNDPVSSLEFIGLIFEGANWQLPSDGCIGSQADYYYNVSNTLFRMPAAVSVEYASNCVFRSCFFSKVSANALAMERGCQSVLVESCVFSDIGAGGIIAGHKDEWYAGSDIGKSTDISIENNIVIGCGNDYLGAPGIWVNYVPNSRIVRNTLRDIGYTGISVGFNWSDALNRQRNALIKENDVSGVMKYFFDGAGIYLVGNQGGSNAPATVVGNYIHDSSNAKGMQFDQGTSFLTASNNLVVGCAVGLACNSGHDRSVCNNVFSDIQSKEAAVGINQVVYTNQVSLLFKRNVLYQLANNMAYQVSQPSTMVSVNSNIYYACNWLNNFALIGSGGVPTNWHSWADWQAVGYDVQSYTNSNPEFVNPPYDFQLQTPDVVNSLIGFSEWDMYGVGSTLMQYDAVIWSNLVSVTADGSSLVKIGSTAWNGGASSMQYALSDVKASFVAQEVDAARMFGLSTNDVDAGYASIAYAWYADATGILRIYESGVSKGAYGAYDTGDILEVQRAGNEIRYLHNNVIMRVSEGAVGGSLRADSSLCQVGSTVQDAQICVGDPVIWTKLVNVSAMGNSLTKTGGGTAWNGGASSLQSVEGDVGLCFEASETNASRMCGLSINDVDVGFASIDYAWQLDAGGVLRVYENGTYKGAFGAYSAGDLFAVERVEGKISYRHNGTVVRAVADACSSPLIADCSLCQIAGTIQTASFFVPAADPELSVVWTNIAGLSIVGDTLIKTASTGWGNSGAASVQIYSGNVGVSFSALETTKFRFCGLAETDSDTSYASIDYALALQSDASVYVYELGANKGYVGTYLPGDIFAVERVGSSVRYLHNGAVVRTVTNVPSISLRADCSLSHTDASLRDTVVYVP